MPAPSVQVAIIGAGPYGLSLAAHLRARGVDLRIFGRPMQSWHEMPPGMFLKSEAFATNLSDPERRCTLLGYCGLHGMDSQGLISMDAFTNYGLWFQRQFVPDVEDAQVVDIRKAGDVFALDLETGEQLRAQRVIVAAGINHFTYVPEVLAALPPELASHTAVHRDLARFAGQDVTVVGGGQSSLQTAALLHEQGARVRVLVRGSSVIWNPPPDYGPRSLRDRLRYPRSGLGAGRRLWLFEHAPLAFHYLPIEMRVRLVRETLGPSGAWWLKERVDGQFPVLTCAAICAATPQKDGVRLRYSQPDGGAAEVFTNHVIAGTGFRVDLDHLTFLSADLRGALEREAGAPVLSSHFESSVRGLYFVGIAAAFSFGPMSRFVLGADFAVRRITQHVAWSRALGRSPEPAPVVSESVPVAVADTAGSASQVR